MTWFKVDDTLALHPKVLAAGNAAMGLWVRAGAWSSQHLTDGFVPTEVVRMLGSVGQAKQLVTAGLWTVAPGGWLFHQWEQANPHSGGEKARKEAHRLKMAAWRASRAAARDSSRDEGVTDHVTDHRDQSRDESVTRSTRARTRPDPTRPELHVVAEEKEVEVPSHANADHDRLEGWPA